MYMITWEIGVYSEKSLTEEMCKWLMLNETLLLTSYIKRNISFLPSFLSASFLPLGRVLVISIIFGVGVGMILTERLGPKHQV